MACKSFAVQTDIESMFLAHVGGHSRVVNTVYGLGEEDTRVTLDGGLAQGANSSPALFIFTTTPAYRYADENLPGHYMLCAHSQPPRGDLRSYCVGLLNYADDDAGLNGRAATTQEEVRKILNETSFVAEALTMSLAVVGACTNHAKSLLLCSPSAQKLILFPALWLTTLNAEEVLMREKGLTVTSTTDTSGMTHNPESSSAQYLGAWFDWGAPKGGDAWAKQTTKIWAVTTRYGDDVSRILPSFRLTCMTASSIMYQQMKTMFTIVPPDHSTL